MPAAIPYWRVKTTLKPGNTVGEIYRTHVDGFVKAGYGHAALKACGYSLGISYPPTWMDWPMIWQDNPDIIESWDGVLHPHDITR